jgi:hypothetical protein
LYLEHQRVDPQRRETLVRFARGLMADEAELADSPIDSSRPAPEEVARSL